MIYKLNIAYTKMAQFLILSLPRPSSFLRELGAYQVANVIRSINEDAIVLEFINSFNQKELESMLNAINPKIVFMTDAINKFLIKSHSWIFKYFSSRGIKTAIYSANKEQTYSTDYVCLGVSSVIDCIKNKNKNKRIFEAATFEIQRYFRYSAKDLLSENSTLLISLKYRNIDDVVREIIDNFETKAITRYILDDANEYSIEDLESLKKYLDRYSIKLDIHISVDLGFFQRIQNKFALLKDIGVSSISVNIDEDGFDNAILVANHFLLNYPNIHLTYELDLHTKSSAKASSTYEVLKSRGLVASIKLTNEKPGSEFFLSDLNKWSAPPGEELFSIRAFGIETEAVYSKFTKKIDYSNLSYLTRLKLENYRSSFISNAK